MLAWRGVQAAARCSVRCNTRPHPACVRIRTTIGCEMLSKHMLGVGEAGLVVVVVCECVRV